MPAQDLLRQNIEGTEFQFTYPISHLIKDGISDVYTLSVALPEGAKIIDVRVIVMLV